MTNKITNASALTFVLDTCNLPQDIKDKLTTMRDGYTKKSVSKADKEKASENAIIRDNIVAVLRSADKAIQASAIAKAVNAEMGTDYSLPKVNALLTQLKNKHTIVRTEEKGKAYFAMPSEDDEVVEVGE